MPHPASSGRWASRINRNARPIAAGMRFMVSGSGRAGLRSLREASEGKRRAGKSGPPLVNQPNTEGSASKRLALVLYRAAVGLGGGLGHGLAGEDLIQGLRDVVGFGLVVDGAVVNQHAVLADDEHVRGRGRAVGLADFAVEISQDRVVE